jgi:hypothetical protein
MNKGVNAPDTSWAAIDSAESIIPKSSLKEYGIGDGLDTVEQEHAFTKGDFERDLRKASCKIKK